LWQVDRGWARGIAEIEPDELYIEDVLAAARRVQDRGIELVVVSLGERGAVGLGRGGSAWQARTALDRPVVDAVGSGDALVAGLVVSLSRGEALPEALRWGVACGAANTLLAGAGRCRRMDIDRLVGRTTVEPLV
jgi:fructose-1-phosphate kinase PfkB-like protein